MRVVVAAFGNELRGDDGFGIAVLRQLERGPRPACATWLEVGTAGVRLAQELLTPCDRLVIVDAMTRGGAPGTLYVVRVEEVPEAAGFDLHLAVPARALALAKALRALPPESFIVGCEPRDVDELTSELSPPVRDAVAPAVTHVQALCR